MVLIVYYGGVTEEEIKRIFKKEKERKNQDVEIGGVNVKKEKDGDGV